MPRRRLTPPRNLHLLRQVRIGDEIEVWWPHDERYYPGHVAAIMPSGRHCIYYTDGEKEELLLETEQWRFRGAAATRVLSASIDSQHLPNVHASAVEVIELDAESQEGRDDVLVQPRSERARRREPRAVTDTSVPAPVLALRNVQQSHRGSEECGRYASAASSAHADKRAVVKRRRSVEEAPTSGVKEEQKSETHKRTGNAAVDMIVLDDEPKRKPTDRPKPISRTVSTTPVKGPSRSMAVKAADVPGVGGRTETRKGTNIVVHTSIRKVETVVEDSAALSGVCYQCEEKYYTLVKTDSF